MLLIGVFLCNIDCITECSEDEVPEEEKNVLEEEDGEKEEDQRVVDIREEEVQENNRVDTPSGEGVHPHPAVIAPAQF